MSARRLLPLALVTAALAAAPGAGVAFADQAPAPHAVNGKPVSAVATATGGTLRRSKPKETRLMKP